MQPDGPKASFQLAVADLDSTEAFYAGILDLSVRRGLTVPGAPEHLILEHDGWELMFVEAEAVLRAHPQLEEPFATYPRGVGLALQFRVDGIEDIYEAILEEDLEVLYPLDEKPYGIKDIWCFDPDGYLVVLVEPVR